MSEAKPLTDKEIEDYRSRVERPVATLTRADHRNILATIDALRADVAVLAAECKAGRDRLSKGWRFDQPSLDAHNTARTATDQRFPNGLPNAAGEGGGG